MAECKTNYTWKDFGLSVGMYTGVGHCFIRGKIKLLVIGEIKKRDREESVYTEKLFSRVIFLSMECLEQNLDNHGIYF